MKMQLFALGTLVLVLSALVGCSTSSSASAGRAGASQAQDVTVTLTDYKIQSSLTTFTMGTKYHFIVTNSGQTQHEVMAGPIAKANAPEDERDAARLFEVSDVAPGETKTADYTFTAAAPAGVLEFSCHQPGHYELGMRLDISVK